MSASSPTPQGDDEGQGMITEINVTPMVDIMLVLLIIFMVTASLITSPALKVELPKGGATAKAANAEPDVVVVVTRTGAIQFKSQNVEAAKLLDELKKEHQSRPTARLLIVADVKAYHGNVVRVMDVAKTVGFQRLGVAINPAVN